VSSEALRNAGLRYIESEKAQLHAALDAIEERPGCPRCHGRKLDDIAAQVREAHAHVARLASLDADDPARRLPPKSREQKLAELRAPDPERELPPRRRPPRSKAKLHRLVW
jgi:excinuclease UvrABC ATPase subunit